MPTASHRRPTRGIGSLPKRRIPREGPDCTRRGGPLAKRRAVREFHVEVDGLGSKPRFWNSCQRIAPPRTIAETRFPRPTCSATCQPQPRRSKIDNSQPFQRPRTQIGGLPFQNRAFAATPTSRGARNAKFLETMWQPEKGHSAASGAGKTQSLRKPQVGRPGKMSRAEKGKGVRHRHRQSAADEPISSFTHPSGRRRE